METSRSSGSGGGSGGVEGPESFGPYMVYERLGIGGMATVHRAVEQGIEGLERTVALKRLLPHLAEDESFVRAFVREAKLASLLQHVNVAQIYMLGRIHDSYFISMELVSGCDVRQVLRRARQVAGPPPVPVTVALLTQLCDALEHAHGRTDELGQPLGIVHRDVSPSNLLIAESGHLKGDRLRDCPRPIVAALDPHRVASRANSRTWRRKRWWAPPSTIVPTSSPLALSPTSSSPRRRSLPAKTTTRPSPTSSSSRRRRRRLATSKCRPSSMRLSVARWPRTRLIAGAAARELGEALHSLANVEGFAARNRDIVGWMDWAMGPRTSTGSGRASSVSLSVPRPAARGSAPALAKEAGVADYLDFEIEDRPPAPQARASSVAAALPLPPPPPLPAQPSQLSREPGRRRSSYSTRRPGRERRCPTPALVTRCRGLRCPARPPRPSESIPSLVAGQPGAPLVGCVHRLARRDQPAAGSTAARSLLWRSRSSSA